MNDISAANINELQRQRDALQKQVDEMRAVIQSFPGQITSARLDVKEGKETKYNYDLHHRVCRVVA